MPGYCSLLLVALASSCEAFALARPALHVSTVAPRVSTPATMQLFGQRKTSEEILEEKGYWPGEWCCSDCGYIYEPGTVPPFEEIRVGWHRPCGRAREANLPLPRCRRQLRMCSSRNSDTQRLTLLELLLLFF